MESCEFVEERCAMLLSSRMGWILTQARLDLLAFRANTPPYLRILILGRTLA